MLQNYYSASEAAVAMGISRSQVYRRINDGLLPSTQVGNMVLIPVDAVNQMIKETPHHGRMRREGAGGKPAPVGVH